MQWYKQDQIELLEKEVKEFFMIFEKNTFNDKQNIIYFKSKFKIINWKLYDD